MTDLLPLLQEFYREKLVSLLSHEAAARLIGQYDINNTYQYIINREETQLSWLAAAIADLGGATESKISAPQRQALEKGPRQTDALFDQDGREAQAFVDRWRPRVDAMTNARHQGMLRVILGETLEQKRFFGQALAGNVELLGRRGEAVGARVGQVLPDRWIE